MVNYTSIKKTLTQVSIEVVNSMATDHVNELDYDDLDVDDDLDDVEDQVVDDPSSSTSVSSHIEPVDEPSPSTSTSNVSSYIVPQSHTKISCQHWPAHIKQLARKEFKDCIDNRSSPSQERGKAFLRKYNLLDCGFMKFKNILYNMGRPPIKYN